jgi:integrase
MGAAMARRVRKVKRREFGAGAVRQLPSGRWQARYRDDTGVMRSAPTTFDTKLDAGAWLDSQDPDDVEELRADPPLRDYAQGWLAGRELKPRTRESYRLLLDRQVLPVLGQTKMGRLTPVAVRAWHAGLDPSKATTRSHAYLLLHAICATAVDDELLASNPCRVRGAGQVKTTHTTKVATLPELAVMTEAMPARFKMMVLLAAWCGLRYGELTELRRADIDGDGVRVERGVVRVGGQFVVGDPKSAAGRRVVRLPPHLTPLLADHLGHHVGAGPDALLFPAQHGGHLAPSAFYRAWYPAREAAGRPDLRFHDLRHTGATLAAATGATLRDLMARLGHSTPAASLRYQHTIEDRDRAIAEALSGFAEAGAVTLTAR